MNRFAGVILGLVLGFVVVACGGSSGDADANQADVTQAEFDALMARVEALESALTNISAPRDTLYAPADGGATKSGAFQKVAADWVDIGTRLECLPTNDFFGEWCRIISPTGYYFGLPLGLGETFPRQAGRIYFDQVGCTGNAYMYFSDVGPDANVQGFVTGYYPNGASSPEAVYMFEAGGSTVSNLVTMSYHDTPGTPCTNFTSGAATYAPLTVNDPEVSGVSNDNYGQLSMTP